MTIPSCSPLFKFGLVSDVQWADRPDGTSFHGTPRYYRHALVAAQRAIDAFKLADVDMAIHLGDIVDYHNVQGGTSEQALQAAINCFDSLGKPVLHCIGNHCLYNAPRPVLNSLLGIDDHKESVASLSGHHSYFMFRPPVPHPGFRFVVLDGYDVSFLGWPAGHELHETAVSILNEKNPNEDKNSNIGLQGLDKRFVKFGGGISKQQLAWFATELQESRAAGDRVIVCCHLCIHPQTCAPTCLLYNYDAVLDILSKNADVVVATLSGHAHNDGYHVDPETGVHHRVCQAILETEPGRDCYGIVSVYPDRIEVAGVDAFDSAVWLLGA